MTPTRTDSFGLSMCETQPLRIVPSLGGGLLLLLASTGVDPGAGVVRGLVVVKLDGLGQVSWTKSYDAARGWADLAVDSSGNVFLAMCGGANLDLGDGVSSGSDELAVVKLGVDGEQLWVRRFGTTTRDGIVTAIALGPEGRIVVAGAFREGLRVAADVLLQRPRFQPGRDAFVLELNQEGALMWHRTLASPSCLVQHVFVDDAGVTSLFGSFSGQVDLGAGPLTSAGRGSLFVGRFSAARQPVSLVLIPGEELEQESNVAHAADGSHWVAGTFRGTLLWGEQRYESTPAGDAFIGRLDPMGTPGTIRVLSNGKTQAVRGIAVDANQGCIVTGSFSGAIDFGSGTIHSVAGSDMFVARYDATGLLVDLAQFGATGVHSGTHIAVHGTNEWSVGGYAIGATSFGAESVESVGAVDTVLVRFSA